MPSAGAPELDFLRRSPLFESLDDATLEKIYSHGAFREVAHGEVIFAEGEPGLELYVIKSGVVELRKRVDDHHDDRVVNYLSTGESVGEMALVTGRQRSATARVPQKAVLFRVPGTVFETLLHEHPAVALNMMRILAYRLELANQLHIAGTPSASHLAGDLEFFDLPEVCQTLIMGRRTGIMTVVAPSVGGEARLYFEQGHIKYAQTLQLEGVDALTCAFRRPLEGSFEFRSTETLEMDADADVIEGDPMHIILEAIRQRDEIERIARSLPEPGHLWHVLDEAAPVPEPRRSSAPWRPSSGAEVVLAREVLSALKSGQSVEKLAERHPADELQVYRIVQALAEAGQIE